MSAPISRIMSIARTALSASQAAIGVVSHNIANASTPGYSRQRAELVAGTPIAMPPSVLGTGVVLKDVARLRDGLLDFSYREHTAQSGYMGRRSDLLGQVQTLHGDVTTTGLSDTLDAFWNAWSDLANDPSSTTTRIVVRQTGEQLAAQFRQLANGLQTFSESTDRQLRADVDTFNRLTGTIAQLNMNIVADEAGGGTSGDLRDARDRAIDQLSQITGVQVVERKNGSVAINVGGITVVDATESTALRVDTTGGQYRLVSERGIVIPGASGAVGASLDVLNRDLPTARAELDAIARAVVSTVNTLHENGTNRLGQTGLKFFGDNGDPTTVRAATFSLSLDIADAQSIAAGTGGVDPNTGEPIYASGRNDVALALAGLRTATNAALNGSSISDAYAASIGRIGADLRAAVDAAEAHTTLASQADIRRISVSGVSIDEELVSLIRFQNAYGAAARLVTVADEMMQTLLDMKR
jgi:flagellar hook-associated protein 1 FlgK